jgi:hypothetical protein
MKGTKKGVRQRKRKSEVSSFSNCHTLHLVFVMFLKNCETKHKILCSGCFVAGIFKCGIPTISRNKQRADN